jgi:hypothetical protein
MIVVGSIVAVATPLNSFGLFLRQIGKQFRLIVGVHIVILQKLQMRTNLTGFLPWFKGEAIYSNNKTKD